MVKKEVKTAPVAKPVEKKVDKKAAPVAKPVEKKVDKKAAPVAKKEVKTAPVSNKVPKADIIRALKEKCEIPTLDTANAVFEAVCEIIRNYVIVEGKSVKLDGIGTLKLSVSDEKKVYNPLTKEFKMIKNAKYLRFSPDESARRDLKE